MQVRILNPTYNKLYNKEGKQILCDCCGSETELTIVDSYKHFSALCEICNSTYIGPLVHDNQSASFSKLSASIAWIGNYLKQKETPQQSKEPQMIYRHCQVCEGSGEVNHADCPICEGEKFLSMEITIEQFQRILDNEK